MELVKTLKIYNIFYFVYLSKYIRNCKTKKPDLFLVIYNKNQSYNVP